MKRKLISLALIVALILTLVACGNGADEPETPTDPPVVTDPVDEPTDPPEEPGEPGEIVAGENLPPAPEEPLEIAVIIKATSSDFWQYMLVGSDNFAKEHPEYAVTTNYGPPEEMDFEEQVAILEDVISKNPDGIVIAASNSEATSAAIDEAIAAGIPVITADNMVTTDSYTSFIATNNLEAGAQAADFMLERLKEVYGDDLSGKAIAVVSSIAGAQVIDDRDAGFLNRMAEIAPELDVLEKQIADNDMSKAMNIAEDYITANPNLIGIFGDNNVTGSGVSRTITNLGMEDKVVAVAFDSDPEEIQGLESGSLYGLVLQDPYMMGYMGVDYAVRAALGIEVPKQTSTPTVIVTRDNMNDEEIIGLLDPFTRKLD